MGRQRYCRRLARSIPGSRAKSSRNAERDQIGMVGDIIADSRATSPGIRKRKVEEPIERLQKALGRQGSGPFFNGTKYSLVDAAYAPFLQRYVFLDRVKKLGHIEKFPRLKAWCEALLNRASTHSFPPAEFEALYREGLKRRNKWVSRFIEPTRAAAE